METPTHNTKAYESVSGFQCPLLIGAQMRYQGPSGIAIALQQALAIHRF
jgi:hypothetical protein